MSNSLTYDELCLHARRAEIVRRAPMVKGDDVIAADEAERRGGVRAGSPHLPPLSEEKKVKKKGEERKPMVEGDRGHRRR